MTRSGGVCQTAQTLNTKAQLDILAEAELGLGDYPLETLALLASSLSLAYYMSSICSKDEHGTVQIYAIYLSIYPCGI